MSAPNPTTRLRAIMETLAKCLADACAQTCKGREHYSGKNRHDSNCPHYDYGADVAEALEVLAELERGPVECPVCGAKLPAGETWCPVCEDDTERMSATHG